MWTYRDRLDGLILEFLVVPFVFRVSCELFPAGDAVESLRVSLLFNAPSDGN
jgi:hypothetical protein